MQDHFLPSKGRMRFDAASNTNKEMTMRTMINKLWRLGILYLVALNLLLVAPSIFAGDRDTLRGKIEVTFLKWVTNTGGLAGVVSGDVGGGLFLGEPLAFSETNGFYKIEALYHINGGAFQFTAHNFITQNIQKGTAVIRGFVADGPLKGARVDGEYQVISPCGIINAQNPGLFDDNCFQGTLVVRPSSGN
jgi:hypothetical protein